MAVAFAWQRPEALPLALRPVAETTSDSETLPGLTFPVEIAIVEAPINDAGHPEAVPPEPCPVHSQDAAALWVEELHDDDIRGNAVRAIRELKRLGAAAIPALTDALESSDYQQRQLAGALLRHLDARTPTPALLRVTVEGLRDDALSSYTVLANAAEGVRYLERHAWEARELLVAGAQDPDLQQSFYAAVILARNQITLGIETTTAVLIEHLADNDIPGDACVASRALYLLGQPALPYLERARSSDDRQQAQVVELIIADLRDPPRTPAELAARKEVQQITQIAYDPCLEERGRPIGLSDPARLERRRALIAGQLRTQSLEPLREQHGKALRAKTDAVHPDFEVLAFGLESGDDFERLLTLQVHRDGRMFRTHPARDGGTRWVIEYRID